MPLCEALHTSHHEMTPRAVLVPAACRTPPEVVCPLPQPASHVAYRRRSRSPDRLRISHIRCRCTCLARDLPRSLQHPIHLIEVEVAEQGRDYSALWNALLARSFQHDFQKMHDVHVINPLSHFFQQPVVPDIVKVGSQVKVEDARLPLDNCVGYSLDRVMGRPLEPLSKRSRLEIRLEDRFEYEFERALHH